MWRGAQGSKWRALPGCLAKSMYDELFEGATRFAPYKQMEILGPPPPLLIFFMWLVVHNCCWTTDRLARRGLLHPDKCPLCDQEDEDIQHLITGFVFSR